MFELSSPAFEPSTPIPRKFTCDGQDVSPPLAWKNAPVGTAAFALIMEDPDAPGGTYIHWVIYDIPTDSRGLEEGRPGYGGPCPPPGKPHHYVFRVYALSRPTGLAPGATKDQLVTAMRGKILGSALLVGLYGR